MIFSFCNSSLKSKSSLRSNRLLKRSLRRMLLILKPFQIEEGVKSSEKMIFIELVNTQTSNFQPLS